MFFLKPQRSCKIKVFSWLTLFGRHSLVVYWVHVELVYGRWLWFLKNNLTLAGTLIAAVAVILLMLAISTVKTKRHRLAAAFSSLGWAFGPKPERVPGD